MKNNSKKKKGLGLDSVKYTSEEAANTRLEGKTISIEAGCVYDKTSRKELGLEKTDIVSIQLDSAFVENNFDKWILSFFPDVLELPNLPLSMLETLAKLSLEKLSFDGLPDDLDSDVWNINFHEVDCPNLLRLLITRYDIPAEESSIVPYLIENRLDIVFDAMLVKIENGNISDATDMVSAIFKGTSSDMRAQFFARDISSKFTKFNPQDMLNTWRILELYASEINGELGTVDNPGYENVVSSFLRLSGSGYNIIADYISDRFILRDGILVWLFLKSFTISATSDNLCKIFGIVEGASDFQLIQSWNNIHKLGKIMNAYHRVNLHESACIDIDAFEMGILKLYQGMPTPTATTMLIKFNSIRPFSVYELIYKGIIQEVNETSMTKLISEKISKQIGQELPSSIETDREVNRLKEMVSLVTDFIYSGTKKDITKVDESELFALEEKVYVLLESLKAYTGPATKNQTIDTVRETELNLQVAALAVRQSVKSMY